VRISSNSGRARCSRSTSSPLPKNISSVQTRQRSPSRIAAPVPNESPSPRQPAEPCSEPNRRCAAGCPRRVSLRSITSSWMIAQAWNSSSAAAAVTIRSSSGMPAPRQPQ